MRRSHIMPVLTRIACCAAVWLMAVNPTSLPDALARDGASYRADPAEVELSPAPIEVEVREGLLTFSARDAPLADVLRVIGEHAGFTVDINGDLSTAITRSFSGVSVDEGVERLLRSAAPSWIMIYVPSREQAGPGRLAVVRVYLKSADAHPEGARAGRSFPRVGLVQDRATRLRTVEMMARRPVAADGDSLVQFLTQDDDAVVRSIAAIGLGKIGGELALGALTTALADEDNSVRRRAIQGLATIGGDRAIRAIGEALIEDADPAIRLLAAGTLGRMRGGEALKALEAAVSDLDPMVRQTVESALAER